MSKRVVRIEFQVDSYLSSEKYKEELEFAIGQGHPAWYGPLGRELEYYGWDGESISVVVEEK